MAYFQSTFSAALGRIKECSLAFGLFGNNQPQFNQRVHIFNNFWGHLQVRHVTVRLDPISTFLLKEFVDGDNQRITA